MIGTGTSSDKASGTNSIVWTRRIVACLAGVVAADYLLVDVLDQLHYVVPTGSTYVLGASSLVLVLIGITFLANTISTLMGRVQGQQRALSAAKEEGEELQRAYREVLENLPIGLFTYNKGKFDYTNWAWDEQVLRQPGEAPTDAFARGLHPEDRQHALRELDRCCRHEEPFHQNVRLIDEFLDERTIEMRGVPVYEADGMFRHLLGFNIDVSEAARANLELQANNLEVEQKNEMLTDALGELEANFTAMVESLVKAVEAKDPYTAGHSERVMQYSLMIGEYFGLSAHELKILKMGTLIHDIGKIGIPDEILTKPSGLTAEEYDVIKRHSEVGYDMIQGIPMLRECAPIVRLHHERLDGSGYPLGLRGDEIPFLVRISAVADIFDAMTSNRAYRRGLPTRVAIDELRREAGLLRIDSDIVEAFARAITRQRTETSQRRAA
jgi:HD-GYP domain-containing protein (c-di-GMP phosphodiesterase class II)